MAQASGGVAFRFPSEKEFEALPPCARVADLRAAILERRPAAREALHGAAALASSGWKLLLTDAATKAEYTDDAAEVPAGAQLIATLVKEYLVRAPKLSRRVFVGRFPQGKPGLSAAAAGNGWELATLESDAGAPSGLRLAGGAANAAFIGTPDAAVSASAASYYLFMMRQEGVIDAVPSGPWFTFRPEMRARAALTLEEAEARMKARARAGEAAGGWLARAGGEAAATRAAPLGGGAADAANGDDSDSEKVRRGGGSEEESEDEDAPKKRRGKRGGGGAGTEDAGDADDGATAAPGDADADGEEADVGARDAGRGRSRGGGGDSPDKGEDWEHEEAMTDDDEAVGVGDQIEEAEETQAPPPAAGDEMAAAVEGLDEAGRNMHRLLMQQRKGETAAEDEEEEEGDLFDDDEAFEDEDFLDPDTDTRLTKLIGMRGKAEAGVAAVPMLPATDGAPDAVGAGAPQPPPGGGAPRAGVKRPRSPEPAAGGGGPAAAAPAAAAAPPAKVPRVLDQEAAAQLAAIEADCGISLAQLTEALATPPTVTDLMRRFKRNLKTEVAKSALKELLRRYARVEGGKFYLK